MQEHPAVAITKLTLLAFVGVMLVLLYLAHNDTQEKVILTRSDVDALKDQVGDAKRTFAHGVDDIKADVEEVKQTLAKGIRTTAENGSTTAPTGNGARIPGYTIVLSPEPDMPRPPDDQIDFDAQFNTQIPVEPKGLNIYTSDRDTYTATDIGTLVYPPLADRKRSNKDEFKPALAEHVEVSPDHKEFHVWLRKGVKWHRPALDLTDPRYAWMKGDHEVTTEDVAYTLDMIMDERADTDAIRADFDKYAGYEVVDKYHIIIRWKEPDFYAIGVILGDIQPIPKWIFASEEDGTPVEPASQAQRFAKHWFSKSMCGCGAYRFAEYKQSDYILLERNDDYWGRRPAFKRIFYKLALRDDEPRYNQFMRLNDKGVRDQMLYPISPVRWKREVVDGDGSSPLLDSSKVYIYGPQRMMYAYVGWACKSKFFNDKRVRLAMTLAANRALWQHDILYDIAIFPTGIAYTESPEYDKTVPAWPYDLDKAAALLDAAGWKDEDGNGVREKTIDGEKVELRFKLLTTPGSPEIDAMQSDWQQSLRKIGVVMEQLIVEWNEFLNRTRDREFDAYAGAWFHGDDFQPDSIFHSRQIAIPGSQNYVQWGTPESDKIIDALHGTFDLPRRYELCHELHRIFHEEQPYTIMWSWRNPVAYDAHIGNIVARNVGPQVDLKQIYWMKNGGAPYTDGRDKGKGWMRKKN